MVSLDLLRVRPRLAAAVALTLLTLAVHSRTLANGFVDYDDRTYVLDNEAVRRGLAPETVAWAFTTTTAANWHPLTWLSHLADVSLYGLDPRGHHATSVALHLAVTLLLFASLERMTGRLGRSAFVAALHAVHPLHVESVAWVAERKDVLSALFAWAAILVWSGQRGRRPTALRYAAVAALLAAGLMAKPMLVTLPILLLLLDLWPLGRSALAGAERSGERGGVALARLAAEKLPLLALAAASSLVTIVAQRAGGAVATLQSLPLSERVANAVVAPVAYLGKAIWPAGLAVFYPHPRGALPGWQVAGAALLLVLITAAAWRAWPRRPYLAVGWLWYLVALVPVLGLVQVGNQAIADRYTYLPLFGVFLVVAWGASDLAALRRPAWLLPALACVWIGALACVSWVQVGHWRNGITLFEHALAVTPPNATAYSNLGLARLHAGDRAGAESALERAIGLDATLPPALENLGLMRLEQGRAEEAVRLLSESVRLKPDDGLSRLNLANAHRARGDDERALAELDEATRRLPGSGAARSRRALLLAERGRSDEAIAEAGAALAAGAEDPEVRFVAGSALVAAGASERGLAELERVAAAGVGGAEADLWRALALRRLGRPADAEAAIARAARTAASPEAIAGLAATAFRRIDRELALDLLAAAVAAAPESPELRLARGQLLSVVGSSAAARDELEAALRLRPGWGDAANTLALLLASAADAGVRDPARALDLAQRLVAASGGRHPLLLRTLAVALASTGRRAEADETLARAAELARAAGQADFAAQLEREREAIRGGWPPPAAPSAAPAAR